MANNNTTQQDNSGSGLSPNIDFSQLNNLTEAEKALFKANTKGVNPSLEPSQQQQQQTAPPIKPGVDYSDLDAEEIENPQKAFELYRKYRHDLLKAQKENKSLKQQIELGNSGNGNGKNNEQFHQNQLQQKTTLEQQIAELQKQKTDLEIQSLSNKGQWDKVAEIQLNTQKQDFTKQINSLSSELEQLRQEKAQLSGQLANTLETNDRYTRKQLAFNEFLAAGGDPQAFEYVWAVDIEPRTKINSDGQLQAVNPVSGSFLTDDTGRNPLLAKSLIANLKESDRARFFVSNAQIPGLGINNQGFGYNPSNRQSSVPDFSKPLAVSRRIMTDRPYQKEVRDRLGGADIYELIQQGKIVIDNSLQ